MTLAKQDRAMQNVRVRVARVLLERAQGSAAGQNRVTHRDMATMLNTGWDKIHSSLRSLHEEGAIKIDRHRIIIETELLQKAAGVTAQRGSRD